MSNPDLLSFLKENFTDFTWTSKHGETFEGEHYQPDPKHQHKLQNCELVVWVKDFHGYPAYTFTFNYYLNEHPLDLGTTYFDFPTKQSVQGLIQSIKTVYLLALMS